MPKTEGALSFGGPTTWKWMPDPKPTVRKGLIRDSDGRVLRKPPVPTLMPGLC